MEFMEFMEVQELAADVHEKWCKSVKLMLKGGKSRSDGGIEINMDSLDGESKSRLLPIIKTENIDGFKVSYLAKDVVDHWKGQSNQSYSDLMEVQKNMNAVVAMRKMGISSNDSRYDEIINRL